MDTPSPSDVLALGSLAEPTRRRVYESVVASRARVTRDEVAEQLGLPRNTAAFHLDRLATEGLLSVDYERRTGRSGPGAGRPSKVYSRAEDEVAVSLPPRHYHVAGELLAAAVEESEQTGTPVRECLDRLAWQRGHELGHGELLPALERCGYEPYEDEAGMALANCPFHRLATRHTDLVCGMNLRLMEGLIDGVGATDVRARLDPAPGERCCVRIEPA